MFSCESSQNVILQDKRTPAHLGAVEDHYRIVEILVTKGADVEARDIVSLTNDMQFILMHVTVPMLPALAERMASSNFLQLPQTARNNDNMTVRLKWSRSC